MKKIFGSIGIFAVILCSCICVRTFAYSDDSAAKLQEFKKQQAQIKKYIPYKIYGKVNGGCHIYLQDDIGNGYDCQIPMTVAEANSSYGKSVTSKMSAINLEELASNNADQQNVCYKFGRTCF